MFTTYIRTLRLFNRNVQLYLGSIALLGFAFYGIYTTLLNLYLVRLGYGPRFIGLVNATALFAIAIFGLPAGILGRRWGVRRMMIVGLLGSALGLGLLPLVELTPARWHAGWLLGTAFFGFSSGALYIVNGNPLLTGTTTSQERDHAFSIRAALSPLFAFVGSLLAGLMPTFFSAVLSIDADATAAFQIPLIIGALLYIPGAIALLRMRGVDNERLFGEQPAVKSQEPQKRSRLSVGLIAVMAVVAIFQEAGDGAGRTFFNLYLDTELGTSTALIGVLTAIGQLLGAVAALSIPLFTARLGTYRTFVVGALGMAAGLLLIAFIPHWTAAGLGFIILLALSSVTRPTGTLYSMELVKPTWRAAMSGALIMAVGISWTIMALGGGVIIASAGYRSLYITGAVLTTIGALLFWFYFRRPRGEYSQQVSDVVRP